MTSFLLLLAVYVLSRTFLLTGLPVFNDEAMYLHWGQVFAAFPARWWMSLAIDGKQPGMPVVLGTVLKLPGDPLLLGRLAAVCFGVISFLVILRTLSGAYQKYVVFTAGIFYICSPFLIEFDRLAMMESAVVAAVAVSYWAVVRWLKHPTWVWGVAAGAAAATGWWFKSTAELALVSSVAAVIVAGRMRHLRLQVQATFVFGMLAAYYVLTLPLSLHPMYAQIPLRETERIMSITELVGMPVGLWWHNIVSAAAWLTMFVTPGVLLLFISPRRRLKEDPVLMSAWIFALVPLCLEIFVSKIFTARYLLIISPFFIIGAAVGIGAISDRIREAVRLAVIAVAVFPGLTLILSPLSFYRLMAISPPAEQDFGQYVRGFSSGYGIPEAISFMTDRQAGRPAAVIVRADSGNPEDAMFVYLSRTPNFRVYYIETFLKNPGRFLTATGGGPDVYFVSRGSQLGDMAPYLTELSRFRKPLGAEFVGVYTIDKSRMFAFSGTR